MDRCVSVFTWLYFLSKREQVVRDLCVLPERELMALRTVTADSAVRVLCEISKELWT